MQLARGATRARPARRSASRRRKRCTTSTRGTSTPSSRSTSILAARVPAVRRVRRSEIVRIFADYTQPKAGAQSRRLRRPAALLGADARAVARARRRASPASTTTCSSTSTRTRTCCRRASSAACAAAHRNITVVGDDAQSIYSFRGAHFRNILDFPKQFPGATHRHARAELPLHAADPRRHEHAHLARARSGSRRTSGRSATGGETPWLVTAQDEQQQTRFVVDRILELHEEGTPLARSRCSFRAGYMSADLEIELTNRKIPFEKWGGLKFLEAAHVKDVLAFLRVLENPRDEVSWYRILMLLPGIGDVTARAMMDVDGGARVGSGRVRALRRRRRARATRTARSSTLLRAAARRRRGDDEAQASASDIDGDPRALRRHSRASATTAPSRASPISISCRRSPPAIRSRGVPRRARARAAVEHAGSRRRRRVGGRTRSSSAPRTARRARSGTRSS